jgi:prepilin-type N-terminal cleavage/methylation domain-containing protein
MKMQKSKGFTLIELMIVLAIIGIILAVAIPQYQKYVVRSKAGQATNAFRPIQETLDEYVALHRRFPDPNDADDPVDLFVYTDNAAQERATCNGIVSIVDIPDEQVNIVEDGVSTVDVYVTFYGTAGDSTEDGDPPANLAAIDPECRSDQILRIPAQLAGRTLIFQGSQNANSTTVNWQILPFADASGIAQDGQTMLVDTYFPVFRSL